MTEEAHGPTGAGAVIADIGGDRGALVLRAPDAMAGAEIEVSRRGSDVRTHVAVLERRIGDERFFAAFYPSLPAGQYTIWKSDFRPACTATVVGGEVTTVEWPAQA